MYRKIELVLKSDSFYTERLAVELAHLIGFESVAMEFPIVVSEVSGDDSVFYVLLEAGRTEGYDITCEGNTLKVRIAEQQRAVDDAYYEIAGRFEQYVGGNQAGGHEIEKAEAGEFVPAETRELEPFDSRRTKGLESLFDKDYVLRDRDFDLLPDEVDIRLVTEPGMTAAQVSAACNIAARFGLETTAISYPFTADHDTEGNVLVLKRADNCSVYVEYESDRKVITIAGDGGELIDFSSAFCETFPMQKPGVRLLDIVNQVAGAIAMETLDGQLAWLDSMKAEINESTVGYFNPKVSMLDEEVKKTYEPAVLVGYKDQVKVYEKEYEIPWEVDTFRDVLEEKLWNRINAGDRVELYAALSEDRRCRDRLLSEVKAKISQKQAVMPEAQILCAYKQGFSWIEEVVVPAVRGNERIDAINIAFKPFLPDGVTEWNDENGATPSYSNMDMSNADKWFDLPIRYLQELYPVDDIIAERLGISRDAVTFTEYQGDTDITYEVQVLSSEEVIYQNEYKAAYAERPYLDMYPGMGKVHPSTGYVRVIVNGEKVIDERIRTDVEAVWDVYQTEILPYCKEYCDGRTGGQPALDKQPFFSQMRFDLLLSEPDERLICREDLVSTLDALHEDLYFAGLDFFKLYGSLATGELIDAPGLILPVIKKHDGKPYFKFTLYDQNGREPYIDLGDRQFRAPGTAEDVAVYVKEVRWEAGMFLPVIGIRAPFDAAAVVKSYAELLQHGKLELGEQLKWITGIVFDIEPAGVKYNCDIKEVPEPVKDSNIEEIDLMDHTLIGYDEYLNIMMQLKRVPGIEVYKIAESYQGRDIYAIEMLSNHKGYVSRTKRINQNPSEYINGRHHANEVSATNAIFMLLRELLTREEFRGLANRMNLVLVPFENADGAAIHYELQKDNPYWKLHIARFNAVGKEFYHEHFKDHTMHTEAKGLTKLWREWLPDVMVDNHGVPTHEWEQQFSGYTSPSYKGFWLPRSLLYGYFWVVKDECYSSNMAVNKKVEEIVSDIIASDAEIEGLNGEWQERFDKYAHAWMPKLFPAEYYKNMINYWISFDHDLTHRYPSIRYPWITTVAYTSEVADETAQDDYLHVCAKAHVLHDIAIIRMLLSSKSVFRRELSREGSRINKTGIRQRPVITR